MNDLIKKFAEQCTKIEENPFGMDVVVFDKEKFDELIIRESLIILEMMDNGNKVADYVEITFIQRQLPNILKKKNGSKMKDLELKNEKTNRSK